MCLLGDGAVLGLLRRGGAGIERRAHRVEAAVHVEDLAGRYVFGDWSRSFLGAPTGQLFVSTPMGQRMWGMQKLMIAGSPDGELHHRVLGFGQDPRGEVYVLTTDNSGPSGNTGKVFLISGPRRGGDVDDDHDDVAGDDS